MTRFQDLVVPTVVRKSEGRDAFTRPAEAQLRAAGQFEELVKDSGLALWGPGEPVAAAGTRILVGVTTASRYDMLLLDLLDAAARSGVTAEDVIDVFNCYDLLRLQEFDPYFPGVHAPVITPLVGWWAHGVFERLDEGPRARIPLLARYRLVWPT